MFCPQCGFEYTQKTNYCKRCGENLGTVVVSESPQLPRPKITVMFWAVAAVGVAGMLIDFIAYYNLAHEGLRGEALMVPFIFGLMFTGAIVGLLVWQLTRMVSAYQQAGQQVIVEKHFLRDVPQAQLGAPTDQIPQSVEPPSVVEQTTRQFAGLYERSKAAE